MHTRQQPLCNPVTEVCCGGYGTTKFDNRGTKGGTPPLEGLSQPFTPVGSAHIYIYIFIDTDMSVWLLLLSRALRGQPASLFCTMPKVASKKKVFGISWVMFGELWHLQYCRLLEGRQVKTAGGCMCSSNQTHCKTRCGYSRLAFELTWPRFVLTWPHLDFISTSIWLQQANMFSTLAP